MNRSILYLQYTNPANYPPLEHSGLILLKAGWEVRYFGIQSEGESNELVFPEPLARRQTLWKYQPSGLKQKLHFATFILSALGRAIWQRPAWVYCSDLMSCPVAWLIGRLTRCHVMYHEHDSPETTGKESGIRSQISTFQRCLLWTRKRVGREADLVVLPNQKRLELFEQSTGRLNASLCVFNCPRTEEVMPQKAGTRAPGMLRLAFHGSLNRDRLPLALLEAMSRFPGRVRLSVVGYETSGSQGYMREFLATAGRCAIQRAVEYRGALPRREDILRQAAHCHLGIAFMPPASGDVNMENMTGASNKPFDYLACGLALLASARPDWEEIFVRPGYGLSCNPLDADSIAATLQWFLEHPEETRQMGERGRERIRTEWNYEHQFASVHAELESSIG